VSVVQEVLGQPLGAGRRQALEELGLAGALQKVNAHSCCHAV
jgi:hypothetical protein